MPRFSILVPVYNALPHLNDALASILNQSLADYEVVLVDDGSTDGSTEVCDAFAAACDNVAVVHQENSGLLLARRVALGRASGDYIVTLDADDVLRSDALERLACVIDRYAPDIIGFSFARTPDYAVAPERRLPLAEGLYDGGDYSQFERVVCQGFLISVWSKCCKREVVDINADYSAHHGLTYAEDLLQLMPLASAAHSFYYLDAPLYFYRPNPQGCTAHYESRYVDDLMAALGAFLQYAAHLGPDCLALAHQSALLQVSSLMHILVTSGLPREQEVRELTTIQSRVESAGLWGPWRKALRIDKRWEMFALKRGWFCPLRVGVLAVEAAKRLRNRVRAK